MARVDKRKCFTFLWSIENISYYWQETSVAIKSPKFTINEKEINKSVFHLSLYPRGSMEFYDNYVGFYLKRHGGSFDVKLDCELSFLSEDNVVLTSMITEKMVFSGGSCEFKQSEDVFFRYKTVYLSQDKLRARCRIWKSAGEMAEDTLCFARTRINIERLSFVWNIQDFSSLRPEDKRFKQIRSVLDSEVLITFGLLFKGERQRINMEIVPKINKVKCFVLHLTSLNEKKIKGEFLIRNGHTAKLLPLPFWRKDLIVNKDLRLSNDVLSLQCKFAFSTGEVLQEIERVVYGFPASVAESHFLNEESSLSVSKRILNENLKSLFHDNILCDIQLKTSSKIFLAHKSILSARSPVFQAMFSHNMKENFTDCVEIEDLDCDTVLRMLLYIYTAEIKYIQWEESCNLYAAADKYEILALKDLCATYLKCNFCQKNVCEALILADTHHDENLKSAAHEFIFEHDVIDTDEWRWFLENHVKLASVTMLNQLQKIKNKWGAGFARLKPRIDNNASDTNDAEFCRALPQSSIKGLNRSFPLEVLTSSSEDDATGYSLVFPESFSNVAGTSAAFDTVETSTTSQRSKRKIHTAIRRLVPKRSDNHTSHRTSYSSTDASVSFGGSTNNVETSAPSTSMSIQSRHGNGSFQWTLHRSWNSDMDGTI